MALPTVGQAELLAGEFERAVSETDPRSIALIGSAGGNGLACLRERQLDRLLCVDVNADYIEALEARLGDALPGLECCHSEIESFASPQTVDLAYGGLLFEYTRLPEALASLAKLLRKGGFLHAVLQLPAEEQGDAFVTPSPHAPILERLSGFFQFVPPKNFIACAAREGFVEVEQRTVTLDSGKAFACIRLRRSP